MIKPDQIRIARIIDGTRADKIRKTIIECLTTNLTGDELSKVSVNITIKN